MTESTKGTAREGRDREAAQAQRSEPGAGLTKTRASTKEAKEIKEMTTDFAQKARELVSTQLTDRASKSGADLGLLGKALRVTGQQLEGTLTAPYVDKLASRIEHVGKLIEDANPRELAQKVEQFARREPLLFLGGALILGVAGARFAKSATTPQGSTPRKSSAVETRTAAPTAPAARPARESRESRGSRESREQRERQKRRNQASARHA